MQSHFEATGNFDDWPKNESGKPTQAAVYGVYHPTRGRVTEILWTAKFPNLEPAMYWAAKKEVQAVRKDKWIIASRVLWQHELTPEQAVEACVKRMGPQLDSAIASMDRGDDEPDYGAGPMRPVDPAEVHGHCVEVTRPGEDDAEDPLASFFLTNSAEDDDDRDDRDDRFGGNDVDVEWITPDPRTDQQKS